ncbi:MAG: hypothetical protein Q8N47_08460 [Bryobacterales bacterium]|nr:hypothetical protein [Bryobacterales bacterium]
MSVLAGLFLQALQLCQKAGLVKLGHVAIDGTKLQANAGEHKAMSCGRMSEAEQKLRAEVEELLRRAEQADAAEDAKCGKRQRGDELPEELARRAGRRKKVRYMQHLDNSSCALLPTFDFPGFPIPDRLVAKDI